MAMSKLKMIERMTKIDKPEVLIRRHLVLILIQLILAIEKF